MFVLEANTLHIVCTKGAVTVIDRLSGWWIGRDCNIQINRVEEHTEDSMWAKK
jgi:hypothetical protein